MAYLHHIENLYKPSGQAILLFKECYALEKIHGTNTKITFNAETGELKFFSGGEKHARFLTLFNQEELKAKFVAMGLPPDRIITVYGEAAGGSQQAMSHTYGPNLFFIAFDVEIGENWQDVPNAEQICNNLGIEFIPYRKIRAELAEMDAERDRPSEVAIRKGVVNPGPREGVVLRPLIEVKFNNGSRVICKHKQEWARETATPRKVEINPEKENALIEGQAIADEYVTYTRLEHILDKIPDHHMEKMRDIISAMQEDVLREASGEIVVSEMAKKAIGKKTVEQYKIYLRRQLEKKCSYINTI